MNRELSLFYSGPLLAVTETMKRAAFKVQSAKGGWIRTSIAPINHKNDRNFGVVDVLMFMSLVALVVAVARVLIAH